MNPSQNYFSTPSDSAYIFLENRSLLPNHQIHQSLTDNHPSIQNPLNQQLLSEYNSNYQIYQHNSLPQILNTYNHNQRNYFDRRAQSTMEGIQRTNFATSAITQEELVSANLPNYQMQHPIDNYPNMQFPVNQQLLSECNRNHHPIYHENSLTQTPNYCDNSPRNNFVTREQSNHQSASQVQQTTDFATPTLAQENFTEKVKRQRTTYTDFQLNYLEQCFQSNQYLSGVEQKKEIASSLNLKEQQVKKWFQNRRMKKKYNVEPQPTHNQNEQVNYVNDENKHFNLEGLNAQATASLGLINQNENTYYEDYSSYWNQENDPNYRYEPSTFRNEQFLPGTSQPNMYQGLNNMQENTDFKQYRNTDNNSYGNFLPNPDIYGQNPNFSRAFTPVQNYNQSQFHNNRLRTNENLSQNAATADISRISLSTTGSGKSYYNLK